MNFSKLLIASTLSLSLQTYIQASQTISQTILYDPFPVVGTVTVGAAPYGIARTELLRLLQIIHQAMSPFLIR